MTAQLLEKSATKFSFGRMIVNNFKCFENVQFDWNLGNGFYLITGTNEHTPAAGANGIGKSSIFDALLFCLYGKSYKGQKAAALLNRNTKTKGYSVSLNLISGSSTRVLKRTWQPNSCTIDGVESTQEQIEDLVGLTYDQFKMAIYWGQSGASFIDLTPPEKLVFLSQLFQLNKWLQVTEYTKVKHAEVLKVVTQIKQQREYTLTTMGQIHEDIESNKVKAAEWTAQQAEQLADARKVVEQLKGQIKVEPDVTELNKQLADVESVYQELLKMKRDCEAVDKTNAAERLLAEKQLKKHSHDFTTVTEKAGTNCPACEQVITEEHTSSIATALFAQIEELQNKLETELITNEKASKAELEQINESIEESGKVKQRLAIELSAVSSVKSENKTVNDQIARTSAQIAKLEAAECPYQNTALETRLEVLQQSLIDQDEANQDLDKQAEQYEFWVKRFPMVRLSILQDVVEELMLHFNQAFSSLGLNWEIMLTTERELKNESIKNELFMTLLVDGKEIDLTSLSGGELQRVKFACSIGVSDLIKSHLGIPCSLMLFDEITQNLSHEGIDFVLSVLGELGQSQTVFLADHRVLQLTKFDKVLQIKKEKSGNSVFVS